MYEVFIDEKKKVIETGNFFANLILSGEDNSLYYFINKDFKYYDKNGKNIQKTLTKTPINGARPHHFWG